MTWVLVLVGVVFIALALVGVAVRLRARRPWGVASQLLVALGLATLVIALAFSQKAIAGPLVGMALLFAGAGCGFVDVLTGTRVRRS